MIVPISHKLKQKQKNIGISFYTPCMNRTSFLEQTLSKNLRNLKNVSNVEFVVLNYNSKDNLDDIMKSFQKEMGCGKLFYYKENTKTIFHPSHAYNMAARLCTKNILCFTAADYFVDRIWYNFVMENMEKNCFIYNENASDASGRDAYWKKDFETLGGFDELMTGYGYDETDLINRAKIMGLQGICLSEKKQFWNCIYHECNIRIRENFENNKKVAFNRLSNTFRVNLDGFGKGTIVEKNFQKVNIELK